MPLDPRIAQFLVLPGIEMLPPPPGVPAQVLRDAIRQAPFPVVAPPVHEVRELALPSTAGALRSRLYRPSPDPALPLVVFFHGGGFVFCDLDSHDPLCRELANRSGCAVLSVDYRLAPEARFPAPLEDCHAALAWAAAHVSELGVDGERLAVCGDSAGANLAAATALLARERGPALRYQALFYPATDATCDSPSQHGLARGYMLTRDMMRWFWAQYAPAGAEAIHPLASVLRAAAGGLPPTTLCTAEYDPLRDEGEAYAAHLAAAGVPVVARRYLGMIHGFASLSHLTPVANRAVQDVAGDLAAALRA